jgi:hypothetical protein
MEGQQGNGVEKPQKWSDGRIVDMSHPANVNGWYVNGCEPMASPWSSGMAMRSENYVN